jgi:hypothetical protein
MLYMMNSMLDDKEGKKNAHKRAFIVEDLGWFIQFQGLKSM